MQKNTNPIAWIIGIVAIALIAGAAYVEVKAPAPAPVAVQNNQPTTAGTNGQNGQAAAPAVDASKIKTAGEPFIGNPNAKITIGYWFDYQCPFCKQNEQNNMPQLITDYVDTGKVKLVYKDYEFLGADSLTLAEYARAVWAAYPAQFYAWHKAIFDAQGTENTGWATKAEIDSVTASVSGIDANKIDQLVASNKATYDAAINADKSEGSAFGVTGTPSLVVGKQLLVGAEPYSQIKAAIDTALAGK
jgi:protein-disulfide isomerase